MRNQNILQAKGNGEEKGVDLKKVVEESGTSGFTLTHPSKVDFLIILPPVKSALEDCL